MIPILDFPSKTQRCSLRRPPRASWVERSGSREETELEAGGQTSRDTDNDKGRLQCVQSDSLSNICLGLFSQLHTLRINYARWWLIHLLGSSAYGVALICSASQGAVLGKGWSKAETLSEGGSYSHRTQRCLGLQGPLIGQGEGGKEVAGAGLLTESDKDSCSHSVGTRAWHSWHLIPAGRATRGSDIRSWGGGTVIPRTRQGPWGPQCWGPAV